VTRPLPVADRIAQARDKARLTQADLAELVGVTTRTIERWEGGEVIPKPRYIGRIAAALTLDRERLAEQAHAERWDRRPGPRGRNARHPRREAEEAAAA
jgi:transcriptional regulator with XRE-family HTH domain